MREEFEAEWARLRRHLEFADGFWIGVVCTPDPRLANELLARARDLLTTQTRTCLTMAPATPDALLDALAWLDGDALRAAGLVSIEAIYTGEAWQHAWETVLLRGNERRERWRRHMKGALLFVGPPPLKVWMREAAPDLWAVRAVVLELVPAVPSDRPAEVEVIREAPAAPLPTGTEDIDAPAQAALVERARVCAREGAVREAVDALLRYERVAKRVVSQRTVAEVWAEVAKAEAANGDPIAADEHIEHALRWWGDGYATTPFWWMHRAWWRAQEGGRIARAAAWAERMERATRDVDAGDAVGMRDRSVALDDLGDVRKDRGDLAGAATAYEESLALRRKLLSSLGETPQALRDLSVSLVKVGDVRKERGDLAGAATAFEESLALHRKLLSSLGETPQALRDLSISLNKIGDVRKERGDLAGAATAFEESLALRRKLLSSLGETPQALRDLSISLDRVGDVRKERGDLAGAATAFEESLALRRKLLSSLGETPQALRDLYVSLIRIGDVRKERGDLAGAATAFEESLALHRKLLSSLGETPQALRDLYVSLTKVGDVRKERGDLAGAATAFEESLAVARKLLSSLGETPQALRDLSVSLIKVGDVRKERGDLAGAATAFEESLAVARKLLSSLGETPLALRDLSVSLERTGDLKLATDNRDGARRDYEEALSLVERAIERFGARPQWNKDVTRHRARIASTATPPIAATPPATPVRQPDATPAEAPSRRWQRAELVVVALLIVAAFLLGHRLR